MKRYLIKGFGKRKNLYWNGCGWTEFRRTAQVVGEAEGEEKIDRMQKDRIMGELVKI